MTSVRAGRLVEVRPLREEDLPAVYDLFVGDPEIQAVHLQGAVPAFASFREGIWQGVLGHWAICRRGSDVPVGLATLASVDQRNGFGFFSVVLDGRQRTVPGVGAEAMGLAIDHVFQTFPLRVLFFDVARPVYEARFARGAGRYFEVDGLRRKLIFRDGDYVDVYLLSLTRTRWESFGPQRLRRFGRAASLPSTAPGSDADQEGSADHRSAS